MKVLFLYPNMTGMMIPPAGISSLASYLISKGVEVDVFDTTFYKTEEKTSDERRIDVCQVRPFKYSDAGIVFKTSDMVQDFYNHIERFKPNVLAISVNDFTITIANKCIEGFKRRYPEIHVIMGGMFPTFFPNKAIANLDVDSICIGEGYKALYSLVNNLSKRESIVNIHNLWVKIQRGIFTNPIGMPIKIDDIPYDEFNIWDKKRLHRPMQGKMYKMLPFWLDLGCPYSCSYCVAPTIRNMYKEKSYNYLRVKSVDHIINELRFQVSKHNPNYLYCSTENFFSRPKEHIKELAERYQKEINLPFWCESRVETITPENVALLKQMGCDRISIGLESGNQDYRINTLKKIFTNFQFYKALRVLNKFGLKCTINNMIGFPFETREMIFDTIKMNRMVVQNFKNIDISLTVSTFIPCGGSGLQKECIDKGLFDLAEYLNNPPATFHGGFYLKNPNLSEKELRGLYKTFPLYVRLPEHKYDMIKKSEQDDELYEILKKEYWSIVK